VILHVRGRGGMSTALSDAAAYSQSHVSRVCLPCGFRLPECPSMVGPPSLQRLSSDLNVFSQQPASDADSACPACETLPGTRT